MKIKLLEGVREEIGDMAEEFLFTTYGSARRAVLGSAVSAMVPWDVPDIVRQNVCIEARVDERVGNANDSDGEVLGYTGAWSAQWTSGGKKYRTRQWHVVTNDE